MFACNSDDTEQETIKIATITDDIDLYDDRNYEINTDINDIKGSINMGGNTTLYITNAILNFNLIEDLQYGIYLEDNAKIILNNTTIKSNNKMWEFELVNNSSIDVKDSFLKNHSAVKLYDETSLDGINSLIEELRMDNKGKAIINNCEIYPNMQFFFSPNAILEFPETYTSIDFLLDNSSLGGWKLEMMNSVAQGWQVDVKPNVDITIKNSTDVTLALWSNGSVYDSIHLVNPESQASNFIITELGSNVSIINTEVYFINLYLKGNDNLTVTGEKVGLIYNTKFLEIVLNDSAELLLSDCHVFAQLFHVNNSSKVTISDCLIGSDDPNDPINSEFGIKNNARGYAFDCDMLNADIVINGISKLEITNCEYDTNRVQISDNGKLIIN